MCKIMVESLTRKSDKWQVRKLQIIINNCTVGGNNELLQDAMEALEIVERNIKSDKVLTLLTRNKAEQARGDSSYQQVAATEGKAAVSTRA